MRTLGTLDRQTRCDFPTIVVHQSDHPNERLDAWQAAGERRLVIQDDGRGLSRARNIGWRRVTTEWVVYIDDDCLPVDDWAERLQEELSAHRDIDFLSGHVDHGQLPRPDYVSVATKDVREARVLCGRWTRPQALGFGTCMAVRRSMIERLGGWDERLGPGVPDFPASDDMDFNYRLLRAGGTAYLSPRVRVVHDQWRTPEELGPLLRGYSASGSAFAMKHVRTGDVLGGLWLWLSGPKTVLRTFASGLKRRSPLRLKLAWWRLRGLAAGTVKGLRRKW
jgi:GT2 family glycosyltransferase